MTDPSKPWFVQKGYVREAFPVTWQGWLSLFVVTAIMIAIVRELQGAARVVAFFLAVGAWAAFCWSKTVIDRS